MSKSIPGIHHVTAIASDPQKNLDFYAGVLGLRLVKLTVNFDDPGTYHFYYGDAQGHPGSILTFFPWPGAQKGRTGAGQVRTVAFSIPEHSGDYWADRLKEHGIVVEEHARFGARVVQFADPDGLKLELIAGKDSREPWAGGPVTADRAIRGFHGVTISEEGYERTAKLLVDTMGFRHTNEEGNRFRFETGAGGPGSTVDVECSPDLAPGRVAVGSVHHIAWRTPSKDEQIAWHDDIAGAGLNVTPVIDRKYFESIYFREPGGVLFEIATDPPGFAIDEPQGRLGSRLMLPPWLEPHRAKLERVLPPLRLPALAKGA